MLQREINLENHGLQDEEKRGCGRPCAVHSQPALLHQPLRVQVVCQSLPERGRLGKGNAHLPLLRGHEGRVWLAAAVAFQTESYTYAFGPKWEKKSRCGSLQSWPQQQQLQKAGWRNEHRLRLSALCATRCPGEHKEHLHQRWHSLFESGRGSNWSRGIVKSVPDQCDCCNRVELLSWWTPAMQ